MEETCLLPHVRERDRGGEGKKGEKEKGGEK